MPVFSYKAFDRSSGKETKGTVEAKNQADALAALKKQGMTPIDIRETKAKAAGGADKKGGGGISLPGIGGVKAAEITTFTRQLSTLQDSGLPIVQSLVILRDMQKPGAFRKALDRIVDDVQGGTQLSEAMAQHPKIFDSLYTNLIKAGETAGALETILRRLAEFMEKAQKLKKKVIGAMVYPSAVMVIAIGILTFIMVFIVPRFKQIFVEMELDLPALTQLLIDVSDSAGANAVGAIIGIIVFVIALKLFKKTDAGGQIIDRVTMRIPIFGNVLKKGAVARFTRTLGTLVTSGVGFLEALEVTKAATPNVVVRNAITEVREAVKEGETINEPLARSGVFNDIVVNMIKVGEETGDLDKMLVKIADNYDEEVDNAVEAMLSMMEPILIVFLGGAVGFIVIALFLPLIQIIEKLGGG
jgi:type IV pilus assembly protein PilC